ncbi:MAG: hypothetical protein V4733_11510 [Verrucomicrobiota bacterium]
MSDVSLNRNEFPKGLRRKLGNFRRRLWRIKILEAAAAGVIGLVASFLLVYGLDRLWATPWWARVGILLGGVAGFAGFAPYWLHRWLWKRRSEEEIARLIARKFPGFGDRLLGVIELQARTETAATGMSPRLREAALAAVAVEAETRDLAAALPPRRHVAWGILALVLLAATGALLLTTRRATMNALQRWLLPFSDTQRYTFTRLGNAPDRMIVAAGESFTVHLRLANDSEWQPPSGVARFGSGAEVISKRQRGGYSFVFPGQQTAGEAVFRMGDLEHRMEIVPMIRPAVEKVTAHVVEPEYLGTPPREMDLKSGIVDAVAGSRVRFSLMLDRDAGNGSYGPVRTVGDAGPIHGASAQMSVNGRRLKTEVLKIGEDSLELPMFWTDVHGLAGVPGFVLRVDGHIDSPPTCYLQGAERQLAILPEESIDFEVLGDDENGLLEIGFEWQGEPSSPRDTAPARGEISLANGGPGQRQLSKSASFCPAAFEIRPQKIVMRGYAADRFPQRGRIYSGPITIYVLTRDEHAQMVKNRFDRLVTGMEDLARREEGLLDENARLGQLDKEQLAEENNRRRVRRQEDEEGETARRTNDLARGLEKLFKDAARNPDIGDAALKKLSRATESMDGLAKENIPEVRGKLGNAGDEANTAEKAAEEMDQAVEKQKEALEKMREAVREANDANRTMEAGTFVNRLKKASAEEQAIAATVAQAFNRLLGLQKHRLDPSDARRLEESAVRQAVVASDVRWIQEDLAGFAARMGGDQGFSAIRKEMVESGMDLAMEDARMKLLANRSFEATEEVKRWGDQLMEWAKQLEAARAAAAGAGGGGGSGMPDAEEEDFEFMLRVMRMVQKELDLRARTRSLEQMLRDSRRAP